jgi:hypothetical protein
MHNYSALLQITVHKQSTIDNHDDWVIYWMNMCPRLQKYDKMFSATVHYIWPLSWMPGSLSNSKGMVISRSAILWDFHDGFEEELLALFVAIEVSN